MPTFSDPTKGERFEVPEDKNERMMRARVWARIEKALPHHHHIIMTVVQAGDKGNVHALLGALEDEAWQVHEASLCDDLAAVINFRKVGRTYASFKEQVLQLHANFNNIRDPEFALGPGWLPAFVLRAFQEDESYREQITAALERARSGPLTLPLLLDILAGGAKRDEARLKRAKQPKSDGVKGFVTQTKPRKKNPPSASQQQSTTTQSHTSTKRVCYQFRETGTCKYGQACRFSHGDAEATYGVDLPQGQRGQCYYCRSPDHGVNACPKKLAKEATAHVATTNVEGGGGGGVRGGGGEGGGGGGGGRGKGEGEVHANVAKALTIEDIGEQLSNALDLGVDHEVFAATASRRQ
jgi:hypothetical protein